MKTGHNSCALLLNPRAELLGRQNAILSGTGTRHYVPHFEGCLSLKSVISGSAVWETRGRRFGVHENTYLIINDRQHYELTIDSTRSVTRFASSSHAVSSRMFSAPVLRPFRYCWMSRNRTRSLVWGLSNRSSH
jgi:hypothetical protein